MSKAALKKALDSMTKEQLSEIIIDIYSARKDAKEYFEFYLDPNVCRLFDKYNSTITKEFNRSKRGYSSARISKIKKSIKEFASFSPGENYILDLQISALKSAMEASSIFRFTEANTKSFSGILQTAIDYANKNALFLHLIDSLQEIAKCTDCAPRFKSELQSILTLNNIGIMNNA